MTMHLVGPHLTTTGKRRGKKKFKSAEEAKRARDLSESWNKIKEKWGVEESTPQKKQKASGTLSLKYNMGGPRNVVNTGKSLFDWGSGPLTTKQTQHYTGTKLIGIGTLHKSNSIPIFSDQEAIDIAKMRR